MGLFTDQLNKAKTSGSSGLFSSQLNSILGKKSAPVATSSKTVNPKIAQYQSEQLFYDAAAKKASSPWGLFQQAFQPDTFGKAVLNTGTSIGQGIARSMASAGVTFGNIPAQITGTPKPFADSIPTGDNPFTRALFGGQPIETVQERTKNLQSTLSPFVGDTRSKFGAAPLVIGSILMDLSGFGGGKAVDLSKGEIPEAFLRLLAKKSDPVVIENTLKGVGLDAENASALAKKLAPTKTIDEVKNVLIDHTPVTTAPTKFQISDEGIPLANKSSTNLPALSNKITTPKAPIINEPAAPTGVIGLTKQALSPLKYISPETADVFRTWNSDIIRGKEIANQTVSNVKIPNDGMDLINRYQSGENVPEIKKVFDDLFNEANKRGVEVPYRQNYVPQVYKESYQDIQKSVVKFLEDNGVKNQQALDYIKGVNPLPEEVAKRLKLTPNFEKERVFPTYKDAEAYGLHPKYNTVAELAANYKKELETTIANNKLVETLQKKGLLKPADSEFTPKDWKIVNGEFSNKLYKAPANVATVINNIFPKSGSTLYSSIVKPISEVSGMAQNISLSGGLPGTDINFFALGQLNKELHTGNVKSVSDFIKSNFKSATIKYFKEHKDTLLSMADQGIDITLRTGSFGQDTMMELFKDKEVLKAIGFGIDKAFGEKTFQSFMPRMQVQIFEDVVKSATKKGASAEEANQLAGEIVKKNFGINSDDFARSQNTKDTLKAVFFAPRFRETIIKSLGNTGKAGIDIIKHLGGLRGKVDPSLSRNRRLLLGMILSFGVYNVINKNLNGNYMWDNPDNRKFALRIPTNNGQVTYLEFMPSYLAFARNIAGGALNLIKGNVKGATQQFGSVFSMPLKLTADVIGNSDYFGNPIYKDTDSSGSKALKIAKYVGLTVNHPYIKELVNQIEQKKPLYQSLITGLELPLKFSTNDKEEANKIFNLKDVQDKERADLTIQAQKEYDRLKGLPKDVANSQIQELFNTNPDLYNKIKDMKEAEDMGLSDNERYIKMLGSKYRAQYIWDKLSSMKTSEEKNAYIQELAQKKILTKDTNEELMKLKNDTTR